MCIGVCVYGDEIGADLRLIFIQGLVVLFTYTCWDLRQSAGISHRKVDHRGAVGEVRPHAIPLCRNKSRQEEALHSSIW